MEQAKVFILTYALCMVMLIPRPSRAASVTIAWDYLTSPAPETFVVRRSLDGTIWAGCLENFSRHGCCHRFKMHLIPEMLNTPGKPIHCVVSSSLIEIVGPSFAVGFLARKHVKDTAHDRVCHGDNRPILPTTCREGLCRKFWWLLLDSRVVDVSTAYHPTLVILSSLKPLFFNRLKDELRFLDNGGA